MKKELITPPWI